MDRADLDLARLDEPREMGRLRTGEREIEPACRRRARKARYGSAARARTARDADRGCAADRTRRARRPGSRPASGCSLRGKRDRPARWPLRAARSRPRRGPACRATGRRATRASGPAAGCARRRGGLDHARSRLHGAGTGTPRPALCVQFYRFCIQNTRLRISANRQSTDGGGIRRLQCTDPISRSGSQVAISGKMQRITICNIMQST